MCLVVIVARGRYAWCKFISEHFFFFFGVCVQRIICICIDMIVKWLNVLGVLGFFKTKVLFLFECFDFLMNAINTLPLINCNFSINHLNYLTWFAWNFANLCFRFDFYLHKCVVYSISSFQKYFFFPFLSLIEMQFESIKRFHSATIRRPVAQVALFVTPS